MKKYLLIFAVLIAVAVTDAMGQTAAMETKVSELKAKSGVVLDAWIDEAPRSLRGSGMLYWGRIGWVQISGQTVTQKSHEVLVLVTVDAQLQVTGQTAYWVASLPEPLQAVTPDAYITGRTVPFTKAQVEAFCNTQWKATSGNGAALPIKDFTVSNVDANTVRVTGLFHDVATGTRPRLTYLITLVDANGATTGANVKFEKVIEN